jgi:hypothetical protein
MEKVFQYSNVQLSSSFVCVRARWSVPSIQTIHFVFWLYGLTSGGPHFVVRALYWPIRAAREFSPPGGRKMLAGENLAV